MAAAGDSASPATARPGFWRGQSVLVTGCTGLLGSWLTRALLDAGAQVVGLIRDWVPDSPLLASGGAPGLREARGDVGDQDLLERVLGEYEVETVFHLAAQTIVGIANANAISTFETNVAGTWRLLEACRRSPRVRRVLVASSDKAYGSHEQLPYTEDAALQGRHPYDVSKSCADLIAQAYAATYGLPIAITRCGNLFGGGDLNWNRLVPGTIRAALQGERPVIRSDGQSVRDYLYVEDAVAAYLILAEWLAAHPEATGEAFNFSTEVRLSVLELTRSILSLAGRDDLEPDVRAEARHEIAAQYLSAAKARERLGWQPRFAMAEGLERTIGWYRDFLKV
jgi:CDP-glucose 4,6-dehydratase